MIKVGSTYRTRAGDAEVMVVMPDRDTIKDRNGNVYWAATGRRNGLHEHPGDLIAELVEVPLGGADTVSDGPVRTVTRAEIVPGVYGRIGVGLSDDKIVKIGIIGHMNNYTSFNADELTAAALVFTQLAQALRGGAK